MLSFITTFLSSHLSQSVAASSSSWSTQGGGAPGSSFTCETAVVCAQVLPHGQCECSVQPARLIPLCGEIHFSQTSHPTDLIPMSLAGHVHSSHVCSLRSCLKQSAVFKPSWMPLLPAVLPTQRRWRGVRWVSRHLYSHRYVLGKVKFRQQAREVDALGSGKIRCSLILLTPCVGAPSTLLTASIHRVSLPLRCFTKALRYLFYFVCRGSFLISRSYIWGAHSAQARHFSRPPQPVFKILRSPPVALVHPHSLVSCLHPGQRLPPCDH